MPLAYFTLERVLNLPLTRGRCYLLLSSVIFCYLLLPSVMVRYLAFIHIGFIFLQGNAKHGMGKAGNHWKSLTWKRRKTMKDEFC